VQHKFGYLAMVFCSLFKAEFWHGSPLVIFTVKYLLKLFPQHLAACQVIANEERKGIPG
jgi:hypothetical protein